MQPTFYNHAWSAPCAPAPYYYCYSKMNEAPSGTTIKIKKKSQRSKSLQLRKKFGYCLIMADGNAGGGEETENSNLFRYLSGEISFTEWIASKQDASEVV